ncbi:hypothetical protein FACS1894216_03620 [Synergistales bacterium]|nr:hypothetical protein FACS1894216_03620 [Synergistales bacterium]
MRINTNIMSLVSYNAASKINTTVSKSLARLSTGLRINTAADDAAGLAISEKMTSQIRGLDQAARNAQDGISLLQTAEGAMNEIHSILQRMRELSVQAANDVLTQEDRDYIQIEVSQLTEQVNAIANQTQFNKKKILNGDSAVLWSTSTYDLGVIVGGTLLSKDQFGSTLSAAGNYKITFDALQAGAEQIQKSNIMYLKHGTHETNVAFGTDENGVNLSGLLNLQALNMVEGVWRIETRDNPFGGVRYYHGSTEYTTDAIGAEFVGGELSASDATGMMAMGEYDVRLSNNVPMMAEFTNAYNDGVVNDVNLSNRNAGTNFDAVFTVEASAAGANSATSVYRRDTTTITTAVLDADINTKTDADINVFTRYEVTNETPSEILTGEINFYTEYIAPAGNIDATLTYQTAAASTVGVDLSYVSGDDSIVLKSTFHFGAGQSVTFTNDNVNVVPPTLPDPSFITGSADGKTFEIVLDGLTMDQATSAISTAMFNRLWMGGNGVTSVGSYDTSAQSISAAQIVFDSSGSNIGITDTGTSLTALSTMGWAGGVYTSNSQSLLGTPNESYDENLYVQINGLNGKSLSEIRDALNSASGTLYTNFGTTPGGTISNVLSDRNITVNVVSDSSGINHLEFVQNGTNVRYEIEILGAISPASSTLITELGLTPGNNTLAHNGGTTPLASASVYDGFSLDTAISIGALSDITQVAAALNAGLTSLPSSSLPLPFNTGDVVIGTAAGTNIGTLHLDVENNSMYEITFRDFAGSTVLGELMAGAPGFSGSITLGRDRSSSEHADGINVFHNKTVSVDVGGKTVTQIAADLINGVQAVMTQDQINGNNTDVFFSDNGNDTITVGNPDPNNVYKIAISGGAVDSLWGGGAAGTMVSVDRGAASSPSATSSAAAARTLIGTVDVGSLTIEDAYTALQNFLSAHTIDLPDLDITWATDPNDLPQGNLNGQLRLTNNTSGAAVKRYVITQTNINSTPGGVALFSSSEYGLNPGQNATSRAIRAQDSVTLRINAVGNWANGSSINAVRDVVLWDGTEPAVINHNLAQLNAAAVAMFGTVSGTNFYTSFIDTTDLANGDSWILYTNAAGTAGSSDLVTIDLYDGVATVADKDGKAGVSEGIKYYFNNGALDGNSSIWINQMTRQGPTGFTTLSHDIDFGAIADTRFQYGERGGAGNPDYAHWGMTNSSQGEAGVRQNAWYSHAYYGGDTTYYFAGGADADDVVRNVQVNKQNDVNATIMFTYAGGDILTYKLRGYDRDAKEITDLSGSTLVEGSVSIAALSAASTSPVIIEGIEFEAFDIDASKLALGDKFVVNVAAAAKLDNANTTLATGGAFESNVNISIDGDPMRQERNDWNTKMQYRFKSGEDDKGTAINLLGFVVDPTKGNNNVEGVGYYGGYLELDTSKSAGGTGGFNAASTVGIPGSMEPNEFWIRAEVNNQGETKPIASALVTSVYFQEMENDNTKNVADFIAGLSYSNYKYGVRADGYGPLNETGPTSSNEQYNPYNASLIFDVLKVEDGMLTLRVQGHVIDLDGRQWYAEEEEFYLDTSQNTSQNSAVTPPVKPAVVRDPVVLFLNSEFGGLYFDEFTLGGHELWTAGDRFTLSLVASGGDEDDINDKDIDEIGVFSDNRGTNMPHSFRFRDGVLDNSTVELGIYQLTNNIAKPDSSNFAKDQVMDGTLKLSFGDYHPPVAAGAANGVPVVKEAVKFDIVYQRGMDAGKAHFYSRTEDIAQFWDKNGVFILDNKPERLSIKIGEREMTVDIGAGAEIGKLAEYISQQIWLKLLMQYDGVLRGEDDTVDIGYKPYLMDEGDKNEIFKFINNVPGKNNMESVVGTILAHSVIPGSEYAMKMYGSEALMKAFSWNTVQDAVEDEFNVNITDAHSGKSFALGAKVQAGKLAVDLITPGISIDIDGAIGISSIKYNKSKGSFAVNLKDTFAEVVHLADNAALLQIGANEGEDTILTLVDLSAAALGIKNLDVRSREDAARSITRIDNAISKVSTQRALVGAQINRLEHTIANLSTSSVNLTESRSRIQDTNFAKEMMEFTKLNILSQAANSMLSQANQMPQNILALMR